jgi:hypothetical protein
MSPSAKHSSRGPQRSQSLKRRPGDDERNWDPETIGKCNTSRLGVKPELCVYIYIHRCNVLIILNNMEYGNVNRIPDSHFSDCLTMFDISIF